MLLPGLRGKDWQITSPPDSRYNCIAWAAGDQSQWWWPAAPLLGYYWPEGVDRVETLTAFVALFTLLGYSPCESAEFEPAQEKVAIFADPTGIPTHAARQLPGGRWTSKLGNMADIEHDLQDVSGDLYGSVAQLMRRPRPSP